MSGEHHYVGIDIGGTNVKAGIVRSDGTIVHQLSIPTLAEQGPDSLIRRIADLNNSLQSIVACPNVGIGFPSVVNPRNGLVYPPPNMTGWTIRPLKAELEIALHAQVSIDNDANVAALAEHRCGAAKDIDDFLYVTLGTGVGGAIFSHGKLYHGERGGAGEIGHIIVDVNAEPTVQERQEFRSFRCGVLEEFCGRAAILQRSRVMAELGQSEQLKSLCQNEFDVSDVSNLAERGDPVALEVFRKTGRILGLGIASAFALLDLRIVVIGGGISAAPAVLLDTIAETLRERCILSIASETRVIKAQFESMAGVIGAAMLAADADANDGTTAETNSNPLV